MTYCALPQASQEPFQGEVHGLPCCASNMLTEILSHDLSMVCDFSWYKEDISSLLPLHKWSCIWTACRLAPILCYRPTD